MDDFDIKPSPFARNKTTLGTNRKKDYARQPEGRKQRHKKRMFSFLNKQKVKDKDEEEKQKRP
jgi:hypothetical protein